MLKNIPIIGCAVVLASCADVAEVTSNVSAVTNNVATVTGAASTNNVNAAIEADILRQRRALEADGESVAMFSIFSKQSSQGAPVWQSGYFDDKYSNLSYEDSYRKAKSEAIKQLHMANSKVRGQQYEIVLGSY